VGRAYLFCLQRCPCAVLSAIVSSLNLWAPGFFSALETDYNGSAIYFSGTITVNVRSVITKLCAMYTYFQTHTDAFFLTFLLR
jgi:hypothetical protein